MKVHHFIIFALLFLIALAGWRLFRPLPESRNVPRNYSIPLDHLLANNRVDTSGLFVFIQKDSLLLTLFSKDTMPVKSYPVVLGGNPVDDKLMQGDQCTPEGTFFVRAAYPHEKWDFFVWLDYPTADSWKKHHKAKAEGRIPQDAAIGGEIGIHGVPVGADYLIDQQSHWTLGCISLKSKDIRELYPYLQAGRKVVIE
ncbi:MAG: L,D-transpeptidase [Bacteroidia bacterium]